MEKLNRIKDILARYSPSDYQRFKDTIDMLCKKGIGNGVFQDYTLLTDVLEILGVCESIVLDGNIMSNS